MLLKTAKWIAIIIVTMFVTIYFVGAFGSRALPALMPEHRITFTNEFDASQEDETDWQRYLEIEELLAAELDLAIAGSERSANLADRYTPGSLTSPNSFARNWNRSYEMLAPEARGVAVMLHGVSDSPFSMLASAETLVEAGFSVVVPRMPGHGFAAGSLRQARWPDWIAATRVAARHAASLPGADKELLFVGYSNGGLLAVDYAIACHDSDDLPCPSAIVLLSPAIAITPFAVGANLHSGVSWMPYFERFQWLSVHPEIDPFKFTSFPKRAGWEVHKMSRATRSRLDQPGAADRLPPILTFQSVVDNTIDAGAVVSILYSKLPDNGSELVVYDVNRNSGSLYLMKNAPSDVAATFESRAPLHYSVTLLRNKDASSTEIETWRMAAGDQSGEVSATTMTWPRQLFSLSHIALPFPPDNPIYGDGVITEGGTGIVLGALAPRGESGVLHLSADYFLRTRYNPFFAYQEERFFNWLETLFPASKNSHEIEEQSGGYHPTEW